MTTRLHARIRLLSLVATLLLAAGPAASQTSPTGAAAVPDAAPGDAGPVSACLEKNIPARTSEQVVEFIATDRVGGERMSRAKIIGKRFDSGLRKVVLRFSKPIEMRGSSLLVEETERGPNDMFLYTPEMRKVKRVSAEAAGGTLFGTDFSYEDFERWQRLNKPGSQERLPDAEVDGRAVYVLESRPSAESGSSYEAIVSYVDQETCVVMKTESFEKGRRLRKVLRASPESVIEENGIHVATQVQLEDLRDETHTRVMVEDLAVDRDIQDAEFNVSRLTRRR